tara:strand:- start:1687 stop:1983 length:297 start_codon:yes stop_codon:yes gene_type:complete
MAKFASSVRFKAKDGYQEELKIQLKSFDTKDYPGALSHQIVDIGDGRFQTTIVWENEDALISARSNLVKFLDDSRHLLVELSPELGVTDPISGHIVEN